MSDLTRLIEAAHMGDRKAAGELFPIVYDELRKIAASKMSEETPGHTLEATALVHEAYLRLVGNQQFDGRGHFFAAAAEAMRRILIDHARQKQSEKRGGRLDRVAVDADQFLASQRSEELLALDEALDRLAAHDLRKAKLVELKFFAGLSLDQVAEVLGISPATADRDWAYARSWLHCEISKTS